MRFYRVYQRLCAQKYKNYGDMIALLRVLAKTDKFTHNEVLPMLAPNDRRNVLRIFSGLGLIKISDSNPQLHTYQISKVTYKFLKYLETINLDEFKLGPYKVFMDLESLNAYLMPAQKPMKVAIKEDIPMSNPDLPPYQQLIITGADNSSIAALHILGTKTPLQFVDQELPGVMNFINHDIEFSKIGNAVLYTERIGSTWGWTLSGSIGPESNTTHIFKTYWDDTMKLEENLVRERLMVLTSFVGILGTAHLLKSIKIEGARS